MKFRVPPTFFDALAFVLIPLAFALIAHVQLQERHARILEGGRLLGILKIETAFRFIKRQGDPEKALSLVDDVSRSDLAGIMEPTCHYARGCILEDLCNDDLSAEAEYGKALAGKWTDDLVPCADRLARLKAEQGDLADAISLWERASKMDPDNVSVLWNLSIAYRAAGNAVQSERFREAACRKLEKRELRQ